ncbi:hypothetical protein UPYG_G00241390 [Umbra pygmaea]|uniref:Uncharacterized protein n=1 Tax=Umbra pygmaea TaxID=75934 RepID=A0ABD0WFJ0_UMBPY
MTMDNDSRFQSQLTALLNAVMRAAVVEIVQLVETNAVTLRQELSKSKRQNEALKVENESNKMKLQSLEAKLSLAANARDVGLCQVAEAGGGKDDFDQKNADGKACAETTGSGRWSLELTCQSQQAVNNQQKVVLRAVSMEKVGIPVNSIKKEMNECTEHETQSPVKDEQTCPKVDMVYGKEWSQSLWSDGSDKGDIYNRSQKEESPGPSITQHQLRKRRKSVHLGGVIKKDNWFEQEDVSEQPGKNIDATIPLIADSELPEYRLSTFCSQENYVENITERFRGRLGCISANQKPRVVKTGLLGNTNARKKQRIIELGWMDFSEKDQEYKQVRTANGGGTRHLNVDKQKTVEDIKVMAEAIFFPNGISRKETRLEDYQSDIQWKYCQVNNSSTVDELYEETKVGCLRLYLCTKAHNVRDFRIEALQSSSYEH